MDNCKNINNEAPKSKSDGKWHDPIDNPMLCLYSQGGGEKPWHGNFGDKIRDGVSPHTGVDLFAMTGSNVYACVDGVVVRSETNPSMFGNMIVIKVDDNDFFKKRRKKDFKLLYENKGEILTGKGFDFEGPFYLVYAHLKERKKKINDIVKAGDIIGLTGTSGENGVSFKTRNPHLHFEIMNLEKQKGTSNKCSPGIYIDYLDEYTMSKKQKEYQKEISKKDWSQ